jgi:hypothetical protein
MRDGLRRSRYRRPRNWGRVSEGGARAASRHQRVKRLHLERNLQLEKKRRLEDQQLEALRQEKKLRLEQLVK